MQQKGQVLVFFVKRSRGPGWLYTLAAIIALITGCVPQGGANPRPQNAKPPLTARKNQPQVMSANNYLAANDLAAFQLGRSKNDVLKDVQWRGHVLGACEHEGKSICAVFYDISADGHREGVCADAIFIDEKFVKFVPIMNGVELGIQVADPTGARMTIPKPRRLDDCRWLIEHAEHAPLDVHELTAQAKASSGPEVILRLRNDHETRNAQLRDQFNLARLSIGMTATEVRATFKSSPMEEGKAKSGTYEIYGSNEVFGRLHHPPFNTYSNVLVLYRDDRAIMILPVSTDNYPHPWRVQLGEWFTDLPPPPRTK